MEFYDNSGKKDKNMKDLSCSDLVDTKIFKIIERIKD